MWRSRENCRIDALIAQFVIKCCDCSVGRSVLVAQFFKQCHVKETVVCMNPAGVIFILKLMILATLVLLKFTSQTDRVLGLRYERTALPSRFAIDVLSTNHEVEIVSCF